MKESQLWKLIKENMPEVHWQRIESGSTGLGILDINGCHQGTEAWIELKNGKPKFRRGQPNWIRKRVKAGGRVWVMTTIGRELLAWRIGLDSADTLPQLPDPSIHLLLSDVDWPSIRKRIFGS